MKFPDGYEIPCDGPIRVVEVSGDWYVAGLGIFVPCESKEKAEEMFKEIMGEGV